MPIPKGRPLPSPTYQALDFRARLARDMRWAFMNGSNPKAKAPCYSAQVMLDIHRKKPEAFWRMFRKYVLADTK